MSEDPLQKDTYFSYAILRQNDQNIAHKEMSMLI